MVHLKRMVLFLVLLCILTEISYSQVKDVSTVDRQSNALINGATFEGTFYFTGTAAYFVIPASFTQPVTMPIVFMPDTNGLTIKSPTNGTVATLSPGGLLSTGGVNTAGKVTANDGLYAAITDTATNTVVTVARLTHLTSGTAAAGMGSRLLFGAERTAGGDVDPAWIEGVLSGAGGSNAYHGYMSFHTVDGSGLGAPSFEKMRITKLGWLGLGTTIPSNNAEIYSATTQSTPQLQLEQGSTGDAAINWLLTGGQAYTMGINNSITNDPLVISSGGILAEVTPAFSILPSNIGIRNPTPAEAVQIDLVTGEQVRINKILDNGVWYDTGTEMLRLQGSDANYSVSIDPLGISMQNFGSTKFRLTNFLNGNMMHKGTFYVGISGDTVSYATRSITVETGHWRGNPIADGWDIYSTVFASNGVQLKVDLKDVDGRSVDAKLLQQTDDPKPHYFKWNEEAQRPKLDQFKDEYELVSIPHPYSATEIKMVTPEITLDGGEVIPAVTEEVQVEKVRYEKERRIRVTAQQQFDEVMAEHQKKIDAGYFAREHFGYLAETVPVQCQSFDTNGDLIGIDVAALMAWKTRNL